MFFSCRIYTSLVSAYDFTIFGVSSVEASSTMINSIFLYVWSRQLSIDCLIYLAPLYVGSTMLTLGEPSAIFSCFQQKSSYYSPACFSVAVRVCSSRHLLVLRLVLKEFYRFLYYNILISADHFYHAGFYRFRTLGYFP